MNPGISNEVLLLIRAASCRRFEIAEANMADSEVLLPTAVPGLVYSTDREQRGLYIESGLLEPRALRGGRLLTLTREVTIDERSKSVMSPAVCLSPTSEGDSLYATIKLDQSDAVECVVANSGYIIFPDDWVHLALQHLYREVLGEKSPEATLNVFELGGSSRDMQLLLLSVDATFSTRLDPRAFFANSSVDAVTKMLSVGRTFQASPLLEMIGESHG